MMVSQRLQNLGRALQDVGIIAHQVCLEDGVQLDCDHHVPLEDLLGNGGECPVCQILMDRDLAEFAVQEFGEWVESWEKENVSPS
jgi:hypothetical protein